ncbi:MAG: acetylglutamate kinase [Clostridiaceae bacterium]|nr:acetylglutamate kinase [Clostridia bacterium]NLX68468.1 acetylglutamate kinase [Clostridiaceae bacterium]
MQNKIDRASILIEALPYIQKLRGQTIVIKYGGNAMVNDSLKQSVMDDITLLKYIGINPVLVHGGGPDINDALSKMNIQSHFVNGLRYTDEQTMEVAQMVLTGKTNKEIVSNLCAKGAKAIGICGIDGNLIEAEKLTTDEAGNPIDIGFVGKVKKINTKVIEMLANDEYIPVIAPIGVGENGESYNINADTVAAEVAIALKARKLMTLTDVPGIMEKDENNQLRLIPFLCEEEVNECIQNGIITGGMIPKALGCLDTVLRGVKSAHIIDGRIPHSLLLEIFTSKGIGTMIVKEKRT